MARRLLKAMVGGLSGVVVTFGAGHAIARPAITDYEASRLTLDALTAVPVYHRPVMRVIHHRHETHAVALAMNSHRPSAVVRSVSYRTHAAAPAHHHAVKHRRT
ncbi:hypothetical protein D5366_10855 [Neokomagataea tanensis]|uniref:Uncharacterized protein n=1 Tax=Neokomagataea tanensis TaxID=661191 RepID=A0A4Y6VC17_9PROT|nr:MULTISPECIES: hypothetical protein [Neokomagataea]QDH26007.1 hypothetical protein D5366_10855 [Neokomagataea tanensis]